MLIRRPPEVPSSALFMLFSRIKVAGNLWPVFRVCLFLSLPFPFCQSIRNIIWLGRQSDRETLTLSKDGGGGVV